MIANQPKAALPWHFRKSGHVVSITSNNLVVAYFSEPSPGLDEGFVEGENMPYIHHAANAYPKLVEALRSCLSDLEEANPKCVRRKAYRAVLEKLGEA